ncbi:MAG: L-serine ammonia-lyase, iron-sulfur-dependent, subunit alpha [Melioribacteraceae bacterium]|nr:L-serine ammonia-lyase, iron-sulfur-dependent, subunit alpha [Melioribacteraceae bacterium]
MNENPSIFNDVIGPVMRGPSSSHTAASWRIAKTSIAILNEPLKKAIVDFDKGCIWATNFREQGTVMGINGGLLGIEMTDSLMKETERIAEEKDISIIYEINSFPTKHTNTVRLFLEGINGKSIQIVAASLGGGSFEIQKINDFDVNIKGDYYELLTQSKIKEFTIDEVKLNLPENIIYNRHPAENGSLINLKSSNMFPDEIISYYVDDFNFDEVIIIKPILPIVSGNESEMPFNHIGTLIKYAEVENLDLGDIGIIYEKCLSGLSNSILINKMNEIVTIIEKSIEKGLQGTAYEDRILQQQSHLIEKAEKAEKIPRNSLINKIVANVSAIMESKSAMELIVANPTAGSCGAVGGVIKAVADNLNSTNDEKVKAYFAAGIVGAYFAKGPGFSAEEYGCQVECGAASGMAAAGLALLFGGSAKQSIDAACIAVQNMIGLVCDPIADRVEAPCLGKNITAAVNALSSATMACSGFDAVIPFDEVLDTVSNVGKQMPNCLKNTGRGGLAITPTAIKLRGESAGQRGSGVGGQRSGVRSQRSGDKQRENGKTEEH